MFIDDLEQALYASKIISYTQGFMLMRENAKTVRIELLNDTQPASYNLIGRVELELRWNCEHVARRMHHQGEYSSTNLRSDMTL